MTVQNMLVEKWPSEHNREEYLNGVEIDLENSIYGSFWKCLAKQKKKKEKKKERKKESSSNYS